MRRFLELSYLGSTYHGWQSQPNALGVQQVVEEALTTICREPIAIVGAGRTDTGVNARRMYAHFDSSYEIADKKRFLIAMNRLCGKAITIHDVLEVADDAHARFDAVSRSYKYFVTFEKSSFLSPLAWHSPTPLSLEKMNEAASILLETEDFTSFAKLHSDTKTNICHVTEARWEIWQNEYGTPGAVFTITADRFLRNMVRAVVGTLVDVGRGKIDLAGFRKVIERKDRCAAGTSMPGEALFLWDVVYPEETFKH
jgi:tRNA pseudouridine38-40 synthase